jgi:type IX secretion system PorP/SprF family membrane protein
MVAGSKKALLAQRTLNFTRLGSKRFLLNFSPLRYYLNMSMKKILTAFSVVLAFSAFSQQDIQFTQYMFNRILYNPAYAGVNGSICANALYRSQWTGFDGGPKSLNVNIEAPVELLHGGLGLSIFNDKLGFQTNNTVRLSYSFHQELGDGILGIGARFGVTDYGIVNPTWIDPNGGSGGADPSIPQSTTNKITPDIGFGLYYWSDSWYAGVSSSQLVEFDADLGGSTNFQQRRHLYVDGGFRWELAPEWELNPSLLFKSDFASFQVDLNAYAVYDGKFWGGVSYRIEDAVAILMGYNITEQLRVGYSYDLTTSKLSSYSSGSHEVMLSYCFQIEIPPRTPQMYRNVRFL